jgi:branched-chain amino acid transport system substrate-binding protein
MKLIQFLGFACAIIFLEAFAKDATPTATRIARDKTIKIGLLVQDNKSKDAKYAAEMAIKMANESGGINGHPLQLITRSMEGAWGTGAKQTVDLIFNEKVWALIGAHDGRNAHLVEQATAKTHVVFLSAWASDPTLSQAFVPWYFSCVPNDFQQARAFIEEIYNKRKMNRIAIMSDTGYDSKLASETFVKTAKNLHKPDPLLLFCDDSLKDIKNLLSQIEKAKANGIVLFVKPSLSSNIINQIQQRKMKQSLFGSLSLLGENGISNQDLKKYENLVLISTGQAINKKKADFQKDFLKKTGKTPSAVAIYTFEGTNILIEAIRNSKLDRELVKNSMTKIRFEGITGTVQFDDKGNRLGEVGLVELKNGIPIVLKR